MTPAFTRSALNKGIQMNEVKRYHEFKNGVVENEHGMFVTHEDYAALQQQLTATTNSLTNAKEALKSAGIEADTVQAGVMGLVDKLRIKQNHIKLRDTYIEELEQRAEAAEACTNSLTNAQEALKSAGIEADTVQAGVMELALMRDKMAAVARDFASTIAWADDVGALSMTELKRYDLDGQCEEAISRAKLDIIDAADDFLNAVRVEGADMLAESLIENGVCTSSHTVGYFKQFAIQLRAGNAGKDGSHE